MPSKQLELPIEPPSIDVKPKGFVKSFNRNSDVLTNAPLRGPQWLDAYHSASVEEKKVLAETWLSRIFQYVQGLKQAEYDDFTHKLYIKQLEWIAIVVSCVDVSFVAAQDISPHNYNLYDLFWSEQPKTTEGAWLRVLWTGATKEKLTALLQWSRKIDPSTAVVFGNVLTAIVTNITRLSGATAAHVRAAASVCNWVGEGGIRSDAKLPNQLFEAHQDLGYFCHHRVFNNMSVDKKEAVALLENANTITDDLLLSWLPCYISNVTTEDAHSVQTIEPCSVLAQGCEGVRHVTPFSILHKWLPKHRAMISACEVAGLDYWETCAQLKEKQTSP